MNEMQKGFWGAALGAGRGLAAAYRAGASGMGGRVGRFAARRSWENSGHAARPGHHGFDRAAGRAEEAYRGGERFGRRAFHAGAAGAAGAGAYAAGSRMRSSREYPGRTDEERRGEERPRRPWFGKAAPAKPLGKGWATGSLKRPQNAAPIGDLAKAIVALPLAKRAALADAIEAGDAHTLSAILG